MRFLWRWRCRSDDDDDGEVGAGLVKRFRLERGVVSARGEKAGKGKGKRMGGCEMVVMYAWDGNGIMIAGGC